eukprot:4586786-Pleurochrysis_carterae.AAC.1
MSSFNPSYFMRVQSENNDMQRLPHPESDMKLIRGMELISYAACTQHVAAMAAQPRALPLSTGAKPLTSKSSDRFRRAYPAQSEINRKASPSVMLMSWQPVEQRSPFSILLGAVVHIVS